MNKTLIHKEIEVDFGHRVPDHGSKCRNPHGHRYKIVATCEGPVIDQKNHEENGMIIDFGNIKKYMMDWLDSVFDHGFVVYKGDTAMMNMFFPGKLDHNIVYRDFTEEWIEQQSEYVGAMLTGRPTTGILLPRTCKSTQDPGGMKIIVVDYVPTAENLARHMFRLLQVPIAAHYSDCNIKLTNIRLYETPSGYCDYSE